MNPSSSYSDHPQQTNQNIIDNNNNNNNNNTTTPSSSSASASSDSTDLTQSSFNQPHHPPYWDSDHQEQNNLKYYHHHHHHHHHHHLQLPSTTQNKKLNKNHLTLNPSNRNTSSSNSRSSRSSSDGSDSSLSSTRNRCSTNRLEHLDKSTIITLYPSLASSSQETINPPDDSQLSDDLASIPETEFFHSHHLRTSSNHSPKKHSISRSSSNKTSSNQALVGSYDSIYRSKRNWFSSRRSKRRDSIHALSTASSTSPSLSPHSSPSSLDQQYLLIKNLDHQYPSNYSSSSKRNSSTGRLKRWSARSLSGSRYSLRWLRKCLGSNRVPLGILLGLILFISFAVSLTVFLIHYLDTDKEPLPWRTYCQEQREFPHQLADSLEPVNVFLGVFSVDSAYERRHLIRSTYARHSRPVDPTTGQITHNVQVKFVLGKPRLQHVRRIALEMETYNDIVVLDIQENMNRGKTYAFFNWASENATVPVYYHPLHEPKPKTGINGIGGVMTPDSMETVTLGVGFKKVDFVVKADDDAFIILSELERHLRVAPRTMTYWGYLIRNLFMGGECYALSMDLVNYVASSEKVLDYLTGAEDKKVAKWMRIHPNASQINWVTERCWIYDHPKAGTTYSHGFLFPDHVQRIREEGRWGLSQSEIEARGLARAQSYSTVTKWKERYVAPKSMMTMEEEVEALVEGGGRFSKTDWKRPTNKDDYLPMEKVLFDSQDERLLKSSIIHAHKFAAPRPGQYTPPVQNHYEEPSLKFGRPPSELMATMPAMEDLPESPLKEKLRQGLMAESIDGKSSMPSSELSSSSKRIKEGAQRGKKGDSKMTEFVPSPTLRFEPEELRIRNERFLHRPHGGTVVVHYLKRNEWFLETSLILLGRAKTWDDGLLPVVYDPTHKIRGSKSEASSIQLEGHSVLVSETPSDSSKALSTVDENSQTKNHAQKKIELGKVNDWGKLNQVEEIQVGGMFGGARMFGSPVIEKDGTIKEGRRTPQSRLSKASNGAGHSSEEVNRLKASTSSDKIKDKGNQIDKSPSAEDEREEDEDSNSDDDIRKTQFGGAGWIRGKPRLRVADEADGPKFVDPQATGEDESNRQKKAEEAIIDGVPRPDHDDDQEGRLDILDSEDVKPAAHPLQVHPIPKDDLSFVLEPEERQMDLAHHPDHVQRQVLFNES